MKKPILAVLLIAFFGAGFEALAAESVGGKGMVIQGNQLKAMPGYVLEKEKGSNKRVLARPAGGDPGHSFECACHGGTGMGKM